MCMTVHEYFDDVYFMTVKLYIQFALPFYVNFDLSEQYN